jgi:4-diphosphocytidyl-2-C-methyl-D-erythritol kinase
MKGLTLQAPAKINLYLRLMGKRRDGYNNLCIVFQKISLCDELYCEKSSQFRLVTERGDPCPVKDNLVYKAYSIIRDYAGLKGSVSFHLKKNIPIGAGLGGGSSDAAATLLGINRLYKLNLNHNVLIDLGKKIGADVPFFLSPYNSALGIERGDVLIDFGLKANYWILLGIFDKPLSTKLVYERFSYPKHFQISLTKLTHEVIILSHFFNRKDVAALEKVLKNDLYPTARNLYPEIGCVIKDFTDRSFKTYCMSGSGPTVFAICRTKKEAEIAKKKVLSYKKVKVEICQTAN